MEPLMSKTISLITGDWSADGHAKSDRVLFTVLANKEIQPKEWYQKAAEALKFNLTSFCEEYEDSLIPVEVLEPVLGVIEPFATDIPIQFKRWDIEDGHYNMSPETFRAVWLAMMSYGASLLGIRVVDITEQTGEAIDIGGYGLYY